jgi:hypothetical protein
MSERDPGEQMQWINQCLEARRPAMPYRIDTDGQTSLSDWTGI